MDPDQIFPLVVVGVMLIFFVIVCILSFRRKFKQKHIMTSIRDSLSNVDYIVEGDNEETEELALPFIISSKREHILAEVARNTAGTEPKFDLFGLSFYKGSIWLAIGKFVAVLSGSAANMALYTTYFKYWGGVLYTDHNKKVDSKIIIVSSKFKDTNLLNISDLDKLDIPTWEHDDKFDIYVENNDQDSLLKMLDQDYIDKLVQMHERYSDGFVVGVGVDQFIYCIPKLPTIARIKLFSFGKKKINSYKDSIVNEINFILNCVCD